MIYNPEARTLNILTAVHSMDLSSGGSHCQSAYPDMYTTEMDAVFYVNRRGMNNTLAGLTIQYTT